MSLAQPLSVQPPARARLSAVTDCCWIEHSVVVKMDNEAIQPIPPLLISWNTYGEIVWTVEGGAFAPNGIQFNGIAPYVVTQASANVIIAVFNNTNPVQYGSFHYTVQLENTARMDPTVENDPPPGPHFDLAR